MKIPAPSGATSSPVSIHEPQPCSALTARRCFNNPRQRRYNVAHGAEPWEQALTHPIDITVPMDSSLVLYPGDTPPVVRRLASIAQGAPLTASEIAIGCHVGTHVDAPAHFLPDGLTVDQLALRHFYGPAVVVEFPNRDRISADDLSRAAILPARHILLKTRNSALLAQSRFHPDHCYLAPDAADLLLTFRPLSIGFDYYSLDPPRETAFPAHRAMARAGLPVFVCLDLQRVEPGAYTFVALPLPLAGLEAIPVRAVLFPP